MKIILPRFLFKIERWKWNSDYRVYVSNLGHIKNEHKQDLPVYIDDNGYCRVHTVCCSYKTVHRLVMLTWRPIPNAEELTVDHLNHNKRDNSLENLEWVTKEENLRRAAKDLIKKDKKKNNTKENLAEDLIKEDKKKNNTKESPQDIIKKEKQRAITKAIENFDIYNTPIKDNTNCVLGIPQKYSSCMAAAEAMLKDDKYKDIHNLSQETIAKRIRGAIVMHRKYYKIKWEVL